MRRLRSAPGLLLLVQATVLVSTVLVSTAPMYADAVDRVTVRAALDSAGVDGRTVETTARVDAGAVPDALDALASVRTAALPDAARTVSVAETDRFEIVAPTRDGPDGPVPESTTVATMRDRSTMFAPVASSEAVDDSLPGAALHVGAAELLRLELGDEVVLSRSDLELRVELRKLLAPVDVDDERWLDRAEYREPSVSAGEFTTVGPFWVDESTLATLSTTVTVVDRAALAPGDVAVADVASVASSVTSLDRAARAALGATSSQPPSVTTSLDEVLERVDRQLSAGGSVIVLVLLQVVAVALVATGLAASIVGRARRHEIRLQRLRGATSLHLLGAAVAEALLLVTPAVLLGPPLAALAIDTFGWFGPLADAGLEVDGRPTLAALGAAAAVGALSAALVVAPSVRPPRAHHRSLLLDRGLDVVVAAAAIAGLWRLAALAGATERSEVLGADPVQVVAPALGVLAGTMIALRVVRVGSRLAERRTRTHGSTAAHLAGASLIREPGTTMRVVSVVVMAVAIAAFTAVLGASWDRSGDDRADAAVSADVVVDHDLSAGSPLDPRWRTASVAAVDGVRTAVALDRSIGSAASGTVPVAVVAVDAARAGEVVTLRADQLDGAPPLDALAVDRVAGAARLTDGSEGPDAVDLRLAVETRSVPEELDGGAGDVIGLALVVRDGEGTVHRFETEPFGPDPSDPSDIGPSVTEARSVERRVPLTSTSGARLIGPVDLVGIDVAVPVAYVAPRTELDVLATYRAEVRIEELSVDGTPIDVGGSWVVREPETSSAVRRSPSATVLADPHWTLDVDSGATTARRSRLVVSTTPTPDDGVEPLPALVTRSLAGELAIGVGAVVPVRLDGLSVDTVVAGVVDAVPFAVEERSAVLLDWGGVQDRRYLDDGARRAPGATAVAVAGAADRADVDRVVSAFRSNEWGEAVVADRLATARRSGVDPIAVSLLGALALAAGASVLIAFVVLALSAAAASRDRRATAAALRALGHPNSTVRRWTLAEIVPALLVAIVVGVTTAFLLAALTLESITIGDGGAPAVPPPVVVVPVGTVAAVVAVIVAAGLACPLVVSGALRRVRPADELRAGVPA